MGKIYKDSFTRFSVFILIAYPLWSWVFTKTVFSNEKINYVFFLLSAGSFFYLLFQNNGRLVTDKTTKVWLPSLIYIVFLCVLAMFVEKIAWWFCCLALLLIAVRKGLTHLVPLKLFVFCGIYAIAGVLVQLFFPAFHSSYVTPLFILGDELSLWAENYGFSGFTYQLDVTGFYILFFEAVWLYMYGQKQKTWVYWTVLTIIIISVFLTGKRTISLLSIVPPLLVYLLSQKKASKMVVSSVLIAIVGLVLVEGFISNYSQYSDNIFLRRFANTVQNAHSGEDFESRRGYLREMAIKAWEEHPITGIGFGKYQEYTGAYTDAHNAYLQVLCEQGIIGFTLWIVPIILCLIYTRKTLQRLEEGSEDKQWLRFSLYFQLLFVLYALTGNPMSNNDRFIPYFMSIAILSEIRYNHYHNRIR